MMPRIIYFTFAAFLAGCATLSNPLPDSYAGPTAKVRDTISNNDKHKGDICVMSALDGKAMTDSIVETEKRQRGMGLTLNSWVIERRVPAQPVRATLRCETVYSAPIFAMVGTNYRVDGVVDFVPQAGGHYVVRGVLTEAAQAVWIEDDDTGTVVTEKVHGIGKPTGATGSK
ncbi:MAG: hypothetical protein ABI411_05915 [Tahibacter sp.]